MDSRRATSLENLPTEILIQIVEYVAYYGGSQRREAILEAYNPRVPSVMGLQSLRLTSKRLRILATPVLFRRIRLHRSIDSAALQALPLAASPVSRHVRRLVISSSCAMPSEVTERFAEEFYSNLNEPGARHLFNMREADKGTFPTLLLGLFRAIRDRLTSLKIHVADVVPNVSQEDYTVLFIRTLSFAMRNIGLPELNRLSLVHHQADGERSFEREFEALNMIPTQSIFPRSFSEGSWVPADQCPSFATVKSLIIKMDRKSPWTLAPQFLANLLPDGMQNGTIKVEDLSFVQMYSNAQYSPSGNILAIIPFLCDSLKSLRMLGFLDLRSSLPLEKAMENCPNLSYIHLRGVFICGKREKNDSDAGSLDWVSFFEACASKESLLSIRFEVLSSCDGNKVQGFWEADAIRLPDNESDAQRKSTVQWNEDFGFWKPLISECQLEFDALENMRLSIIERRKTKGLEPTRWLELCGRPECVRSPTRKSVVIRRNVENSVN